MYSVSQQCSVSQQLIMYSVSQPTHDTCRLPTAEGATCWYGNQRPLVIDMVQDTLCASFTVRFNCVIWSACSRHFFWFNLSASCKLSITSSKCRFCSSNMLFHSPFTWESSWCFGVEHTPHYTTLHYSTLRFPTLPYTTPHYTTILHCTGSGVWVS